MSVYTADQLALQAHLEAEKAKVLAWVAEDPNNRCAGYATTDINHWAEKGIFTVAHYERDSMESTIWEMYKDVNGIRPRWMDFSTMSDVELASMYDRLMDELREQNAYEEERQARSIEDFENLIQGIVDTGAGNRETAMRWIREANGEGQDRSDDMVEYDYDLPYGYLKQAA